jgi:hypothetical protein
VPDGDDYEGESEDAFEPLPSRYAKLTRAKPHHVQDPLGSASVSHAKAKDADAYIPPPPTSLIRPSVIKEFATLSTGTLQGEASKCIENRTTDATITLKKSTKSPLSDLSVSENSDIEDTPEHHNIVHAEVINPDGSKEKRVFFVDCSPDQVQHNKQKQRNKKLS